MKYKNTGIWIVAVVVVIITIVMVFILPQQRAQAPSPEDTQHQQTTLNEQHALSVAQASATCTDVGAIGDPEGYNPNSATWWFTLSPTEPKQGCNPACVVSTASSSAEVNWRCTGLTPPDDSNQ